MSDIATLLAQLQAEAFAAVALAREEEARVAAALASREAPSC